jgi:acylphosphatase
MRNDMARKLLKIRIYGHVQGVGFRFEAMRKAQDLSLVGFARNERNGTLYIEAQGDKDNLEKFLHWCSRHGPTSADVSRVVAKYSNKLENFQSFSVKSGPLQHISHPHFPS